MGKIVAIVNRKGGVGKTTLSIGLADLLAGHTLPLQERPGAVLAIDLDPQGSLTAALLNVPNPNARIAALNRLSDDGLTIHGAISRQAAGDEVMYSEYLRHGVGLTGATYALLGNDADAWPAERRLASSVGEPKTIKAVVTILANLARQFQYVVVDCPPGQTLFAEGVLLKADLIICPVAADALSLWGMRKFETYLAELFVRRGKAVPAYWVLTKYRRNAGQNSPERRVLDELGTASAVETITVLREAGGARGGQPPPFVLFRDDHLAKRLEGPSSPSRRWSLREAYRTDTLENLKRFSGRIVEVLTNG